MTARRFVYIDMSSSAARREGDVLTCCVDLVLNAAPRLDGVLLRWDELACKCSASQGPRAVLPGLTLLLPRRVVMSACCSVGLDLPSSAARGKGGVLTCLG